MRKVVVRKFGESSWEISHFGTKTRRVSEFVPNFVNLNTCQNLFDDDMYDVSTVFEEKEFTFFDYFSNSMRRRNTKTVSYESSSLLAPHITRV